MTSVATLAASLITGESVEALRSRRPILFLGGAGCCLGRAVDHPEKSFVDPADFVILSEAKVRRIRPRYRCRRQVHRSFYRKKRGPHDDKRVHRNTRICAQIPAQVSSRTSRGVPVRDGMKLWCHSSRLATSAVPSTARLAQRKLQFAIADVRQRFRATREKAGSSAVRSRRRVRPCECRSASARTETDPSQRGNAVSDRECGWCYGRRATQSIRWR